MRAKQGYGKDNPMCQERIESEHLLLRPMQEQDAEFIVTWRNDPDINQWFFSSGKLTVESHLEWFKKRESRIDYMICLKPALQAIGTINFANIDERNKTAEAGKMIGDKNLWGKGFGTEAFRLWVKYGFEKLKLDKIYVRTYPDNTRNMKVNQKIGFEVEEITPAESPKGCHTQVTVMGLSRQAALDAGLIAGCN